MAIEVELTGPNAATVIFYHPGRGDVLEHKVTPVNLLRLVGICNDMMLTGKGTVLASDTGWEYHREIV